MVNLDPRLLEGCGETGQLLRHFDWASTPLGSLQDWPPSMAALITGALRSPVPMAMLWGPEGVMIYNDGYAKIAGMRHPAIFGSKVREAWSEAADFNDNVMKTCLSGGVLSYRDQELTLDRNGYPETVWMDLDYSPILDDTGAPVGVVGIVVETTKRVLLERRIAAENDRLMQIFEQAPAFIAMLSGETHEVEMANPAFSDLVGSRRLRGRDLIEVLPELAGQEIMLLLGRSWKSGLAERRIGMQISLSLEEDGWRRSENRYADLVCQPVRNDAGEVTHIFLHGSDVTDRVLAERRQRLLVSEMNHRVKNTLATILAIVRQTLRGAQSLKVAQAVLSDRIMALARAQDLLVSDHWHGADVGVVVRSAITVHGASERFDVSGPSFPLNARAALALSLALHELGTNAIKYGALSSDLGRISVTWAAEDEHFGLEWRECGGPAVSTPIRKGFGSMLIERNLASEIGGRVKVDYAATGLGMRLSAPIEAIEDQI
jgi:PAS domain S-box-containing protein